MNKKLGLIILIIGLLVISSVGITSMFATNDADAETKADIQKKYDVALEKAKDLSYQLETSDGRKKFIKSDSDFEAKGKELMQATQDVMKYAKILGIEYIDPAQKLSEKENSLGKLRELKKLFEDFKKRAMVVKNDKKELEFEMELLEKKIKTAKQLEADLKGNKITPKEADSQLANFKNMTLD